MRRLFQPAGRSSRRHRHGRTHRRAFSFAWLDLADVTARFWLLVSLLTAVFLTGGSARPDVMGLVLLRPVAVVALGIGLLSLSASHIREHRFLFGFAISGLAITAIYLLPLPPVIWTNLPGRGLISEIDAAVGLSQQWRPIALSPTAARNALFALSVPIAVLVLCVQLSKRERWLVLLTVVGFGVIDQAMTLLQTTMNSRALYFYQVTNRDAGVGLFANRNHNATFLAALLPVIGYLYGRFEASRRRFDPAAWMAATALAVIAALLLATGSRAGLAVGAVGFFGALLAALQRRPEGGGSRSRVIFGAIALCGIVGLGVWAAYVGTASSVTNLANTVFADDPRHALWPTVWRGIVAYWPVGVGPGGYEKAFQLIEPDAVLRATYSNHAHNDWLEVLLTLGLPGALLGLTAFVAFGVAAVRVWRMDARRRSSGIMGLAIILVTAIGSGVDYPLRTPILASLFVLACCWVAKTMGDDVPYTSGTVQRQV